MKITFLGATEDVTGSKYLVEHANTKILVDCGLFQGQKEIRKHNWDPFPIELNSIDAIVLTHAHLDHSGYVPLMIKKGFKGKIYCSQGTYELCAILLKDSGFLQEEDAKRANEYGYSRHSPALPLYTVKDVEKALKFFQIVDYDAQFSVGALKITLIRSGHIIGSSFVVLFDGKETLTFSGDLGRPEQLVMKAPPHLKHTDFLVLESTYGDQLHAQLDPIAELADVVHKVIEKKGVLIIPAFAVGRTQMILYCLYQLIQKKTISKIPIFLDSPMAINVTDLYCAFNNEHTLSASTCKDAFAIAQYVRTVPESMQIDKISGPAIIIAGSGMADGGRVLHHFTHFISDAKNTILFVGFQAKGTNGRYLVNGADTIKIYGKEYAVFATIKNMDIFSAHADSDEILEWLSSFETKPKKLFLTHGELRASQALKKKIEDRFGWSVVIPKYLSSFDLQ